jgi:serine/threonine protein kinase
MPQILAGRYIPEKLLAKSGLSNAYLGRDRHSTQLRKCVIKQFQPSDDFNQKTLQMAEDLFFREAEVLETLGNQHPQIPRLYAFFPLILPDEETGMEKEFFYLVQEFIEGETLEEEVKSKGKLGEKEVYEVLESMLGVLQFVHEQGSIHRDIKPSNIIRDPQGKLYLLDFGAVKRVATGESTASYSTGIYTMGFAPPEQMQGRKVYPSTDLYALAATCIHLLTAKPIHHLYDAYHNQWSWREHCQVGDKLAKILEQMLYATPKDRFQSAEEVLAVLGASQDNKTSLQEREVANPNSSEKLNDHQNSNWRSLLSSLTADDDISSAEVEPTSQQALKEKFKEQAKAEEQKTVVFKAKVKMFRGAAYLQESQSYETSLKQVLEFLQQQQQVKFVINFQGQKKAYTKFADKLCKSIIQSLTDTVEVEYSYRLEDAQMIIYLSPQG